MTRKATNHFGDSHIDGEGIESMACYYSEQRELGQGSCEGTRLFLVHGGELTRGSFSCNFAFSQYYKINNDYELYQWSCN